MFAELHTRYAEPTPIIKPRSKRGLMALATFLPKARQDLLDNGDHIAKDNCGTWWE